MAKKTKGLQRVGMPEWGEPAEADVETAYEQFMENVAKRRDWHLNRARQEHAVHVALDEVYQQLSKEQSLVTHGNFGVLKSAGMEDTVSSWETMISSACTYSFDVVNREYDSARAAFAELRTSGSLAITGAYIADIGHSVRDWLEEPSKPPSYSTVPAEQTELMLMDTEIDLEAISFSPEQLDASLDRFDPELSVGRRGAWETHKLPESECEDKNRQAAHSMRETVDRFLEILAPNEEIESTGEFQRTEIKRRMFVRLTRIEYLAQKLGLDQAETQYLLDLGTNINKTYSALAGKAHYRPKRPRPESVEAFMKLCEVCMWQLVLFIGPRIQRE